MRTPTKKFFSRLRQGNTKCLFAGILFFLFHSESTLSQTRIKPPVVGWSVEGKDPGKTESRQAATGDLEAPVPVALWIGMPYLHVRYAIIKEVLEADGDHHLTDLQVTVGMLHHASEGAPLWKAETGRLGSNSDRGFWMNRASLNLEKIFPKLRPHNSDKLDSWMGVFTVTGQNYKSYAVPELGWSWISTDGFLFDINAPHRIRIGYQDREWMGAAAFIQDWAITNDHDARSGLKIAKRRSIAAQASREIFPDLELLVSAGVRLPNVSETGMSIRWTPRP